MSQEQGQSLVQGIFDPTPEELSVIGRDVFVLKSKPVNGSLTTTYHKWERIWEERLMLRIMGESPLSLYRALSLSIPLHLGGFVGDRAEIPYSGFVVAVPRVGPTRVIPMSVVEWI